MGTIPGFLSNLLEPSSIAMALIGAAMVTFRVLPWRRRG